LAQWGLLGHGEDYDRMNLQLVIDLFCEKNFLEANSRASTQKNYLIYGNESSCNFSSLQ